MNEPTPLGAVLKQSHGRPFAQFGGANPNNKPYFYGLETSMFYIGSPSIPSRGGVNRIVARDPRNASRFVTIGKTVDAPDFPTAPVTFMEKRGGIPRHLVYDGCTITYYLVKGQCGDLSDMDRGWDSDVEIYSNGVVMEVTPSDRGSQDADEILTTEITHTFESIYRVGMLQLARRNDATIAAAVGDITYAPDSDCDGCISANNGSRVIYAVENGAAASKPVVWYSTDGGTTWGSASLAASANNDTVASVRVMGGNLVIVTRIGGGASTGAYFYAPINPRTGVPGTFVIVTTGFTASRQPNQMSVLGPNEAYIACDGGEILKIDRVGGAVVSLGIIASGVNLTAIDASGAQDMIVAGGAAGQVYRSYDRGRTFTAAAVVAAASQVKAISIVDRVQIHLLSDKVYFTQDAGDAVWVTQLNVSGATMGDMVWATPEVGYVGYISGGSAIVACTLNGGYSWSALGSRMASAIGGTPAITAINRLAVPITTNYNVAANYLAACGACTADGFIATGGANVI